jgi:FkbM family methyltransferase
LGVIRKLGVELLNRVGNALKSEGVLGVANLVKRRVFRSYMHWCEAIGNDVVWSFYGVKLVPNWRDKTFQFYVVGGYGTFFSNFLKWYSCRKFVFVDIGANQGLYSLLAAKNKYCEALWIFEPRASVMELCKQNITLNSTRCRVEFFQVAISDEVAKKKLLVDPMHSGTASLRKTGTEHFNSIEEIHCVNHIFLNELAKKKKNQNFIVKIDVEGLELVVIKELGCSALIDYVSWIYVEVDLHWLDFSELDSELSRFGFSEFSRNGENMHFDVLYKRGARS